MADAENPAQRLLDEEFPPGLRPLVPPALKRAYNAVDRLIETTEWLDTPSGRFQRGDLIVKAAEFQFHRLATAGNLPFEISWEHYAAPTGKHLVMRSKSARVTINQISDPSKKPRFAVFRERYAVPNTAYLWPEWNEEASREEGLKHLVLLHGYQDLIFACIAVPHPTAQRLVWRTENLLGSDDQVPGGDPGPGEEGPSESPDPEAIEDLVRHLRDGA